MINKIIIKLIICNNKIIVNNKNKMEIKNKINN